MKTFARQLVRSAATLPLVGPMVRILAAIVRLPELRVQVAALAADIQAPGAPRPALWQAVTELRENQMGETNLARSVPVALRRLTRQVHDLRQRLDAAGIDHGATCGTHKTAAQPLPAGPCKLYLGSGEAAPAGYLNVAAHAAPGVDIVAEPGALPLAPGQAEEIFLVYQFEGLAPDELQGQVLPHLFACLQPGGRLRAQVADAGAAIAAYTAGGAYEDLHATLYGAAQRDGRVQLNLFTRAHLAGLLREAGFGAPRSTPAGPRDGRPCTFDIVADKPGPATGTH